MGRLKIVLALLSFLCIFLLNGRIGSSYDTYGATGSGSAASTVSISNSATVANSAGNTIPVLSSFTLWGQKDQESTAIAGEFVGGAYNHIVIQVPPGTESSATFTVTFTGADTIFRDEDNGADTPVLNGSKQTFALSKPVRYTVWQGTAFNHYNILLIKMRPYFTKYTSECIKDLDGNTWSSNPISSYAYWQSANSDTTNLFSACNIPIKNWDLPSDTQYKAMINQLPLAYRTTSERPATRFAYQWFNAQGFYLPNDSARNYWGSENKNNPNNVYLLWMSKNMGVLSKSKASPTAQNFAWPFHHGDVKDAKTLTDFSMYMDGKEIPSIITGNQILVTKNLIPQERTKFQVNFSTTGGTVTINNNEHTSGDIITLGESNLLTQIMPVTVTSANGDKNIYTLVLKFVPHTTLPVPTMCIPSTAKNAHDISKSKLSRNIVATLDSHLYRIFRYPPNLATRSTLNNSVEIKLK